LDAANFADVDNVENDNVQALASDQIQWRCMIRRQRDVIEAGHSNDYNEETFSCISMYKTDLSKELMKVNLWLNREIG
jgi:hypothetical protein